MLKFLLRCCLNCHVWWRWSHMRPSEIPTRGLTGFKMTFELGWNHLIWSCFFFWSGSYTYYNRTVATAHRSMLSQKWANFYPFHHHHHHPHPPLLHPFTCSRVPTTSFLSAITDPVNYMRTHSGIYLAVLHLFLISHLLVISLSLFALSHISEVLF